MPARPSGRPCQARRGLRRASLLRSRAVSAFGGGRGGQLCLQAVQGICHRQRLLLMSGPRVRVGLLGLVPTLDQRFPRLAGFGELNPFDDAPARALHGRPPVPLGDLCGDPRAVNVAERC